MKKSLIIGSLVFIIAITAFCGIIIRVSGQAEQVSLTEEVLIGDKSLADDISFQINSHWQEKMLWETYVDIGQETRVDTDFSFYPDGMKIQYDNEAKVSLQYSTGFGYSSSGHLLGEDGPVDLPYKEVFIDVASRTESGKESKEVVKLADYYEYFDLTLEISNHKYLSRYFVFEESDENKQIREAIGMRIPKDLKFEATVEKSEDGNVYEVSGNLLNDNQPWIVSGGVVLKNGCYVYVSAVNEDGVVPGLSDSGYGIYQLPITWEKETASTKYAEEGEESAVLHFDKFGLVYPLEEEIVTLKTDLEEKELFLLISRKEQLILQRIDVETMTLLQELPLGVRDNASECWEFQVTESGILLLMGNGMIYYAQNQGDHYEISVSYDMYQHDFYRHFQWNRYAYDYKDGRLAIIWRDGYNYISSNSAYVFILEGEEMKFLAHYHNSLDQADANYDYSNKPHPGQVFQISIEE